MLPNKNLKKASGLCLRLFLCSNLFLFEELVDGAKKYTKLNQVFENIKEETLSMVFQFLNAWFCIGFTYLYLSSLFTVFPMPSCLLRYAQLASEIPGIFVTQFFGKSTLENQWTPCLSCEKIVCSFQPLNKKTPGLSKPLVPAWVLLPPPQWKSQNADCCSKFQERNYWEHHLIQILCTYQMMSNDIRYDWHISGVFKYLQWYDRSFGPPASCWALLWKSDFIRPTDLIWYNITSCNQLWLSIYVIHLYI